GTLSGAGVRLRAPSGAAPRPTRHFAKENEALTRTQVQVAMIMRAFFNLIGLAFSLTPVLVYWLAGYLIVARGDRHLTLGTIVAFTSLQARLFFPLTSLLNVQGEVTGALALFDRIFEYLDVPQDTRGARGALAHSASR